MAATMERTNEFDKKLFSSSLNGDMEGVMAALAQGGRATWIHTRIHSFASGS